MSTKVLIVDDSSLARRTLRQSLESMGCHVEEATDGVQAIERFFINRPELVILDEPFSGLDPINVRRINGLIRSLQRRLGVTSIVVTHDMDSCFTVTDRIVMLYNKRVAFVGTAEETERSEIRYVREFIAGGRGTLDEDIV